MSDGNSNSGPEEAIKEVVGTVTGRDDLVNEGKAAEARQRAFQ